MISVSNLQKSYGKRVLFENVTFNFNSGERYGLVGANGCGKSTFVNLISGKESPSDGQVFIPKDEILGFLEQDQFLNDHEIIIDAVMKGDKAVYAAIKEQEKLVATPNPDVHRLDELLITIGMRDGYTLHSRSAQVLEGLGIEAENHEKPLSVLSGGFKLRVLLAQVLIANPDMLLLDEPTNHLDMISIRWLEKYLLDFPGAVLIISHDKRFLDRVCSYILDIDYQTVTQYKGNYTKFEESKKLIRAQKEAEIANIKAVVAHKQSFVDRFKAKASKARQAQSRIKQLEKIEIPELKVSSRRYPGFQFLPKRPSGKDIFKVEELSKSFGPKKVLNNLNMEIRRGDRVAIIGPNGVGKSTFLKILVDEAKADAGKITWGHEILWGYFAQDHDTTVKKSSATAEQWLWQFCSDQSQGFVRSYLGRVLFSGDDALKSVSSLSGGEIARLDLARLMILNPNVLILDEPTNHLDVETIESLVKALKAYTGTLIFVSHDRWFVSELATRIIEITKTFVNDYRGTFAEYLESSGDDHLDAASIALKAKNETNANTTSKEDRKKQHEENKKRRGKRQKLEGELAQILIQIETMEARQKEISGIFAQPQFFMKNSQETINQLQLEKETTATKLQETSQRWEEVEKELKSVQ